MRHAFPGSMAALLALASMPGAQSAPCPAGTTSMDVSTAVELQTMMNAINCTGEGIFDITWIGSVFLVQTIEVCENKQLTVTGSTSTGSVSTGSASNQPISTESVSSGESFSSDVIYAGSTSRIFKVCNGSTLSLNNLVLEGGVSATGAGIDARSSSSVFVENCAFTNNNATAGGEPVYSLMEVAYV